VAENLAAEGHEPRVVATLEAARRSFGTWSPDLVILDLLLPDGHGVDFLRSVRKDGWIGPVLVLTALADLETTLRGFRFGADDAGTQDLVTSNVRCEDPEVRPKYCRVK